MKSLNEKQKVLLNYLEEIECSRRDKIFIIGMLNTDDELDKMIKYVLKTRELEYEKLYVAACKIKSGII